MKNNLTFILIISILGIITSTPIELRGIVEGFYGIPWTFEDRADLIRFSGQKNMNSYIYAPKDDPYHRNKWREPYPDDKILELKNLVEISLNNSVRFIFAVSPGIDLNFEGEAGEKDFNTLMTKLDSIYNIGVRDFAIFFDDIDIVDDSGTNHANFLNRLQEAMDAKYPDVYPLMTVPTQYCLQHIFDKNGKIKKYTVDFVDLLNQKTVVLYTGDTVVCDGISEENYKKAMDVYKRKLGIWWNYPVNDFLTTKLALGPIEKLPKSDILSIFYNPMEEVQLSKIALATGAEYGLYPETYNSEESWNKAIEEQFGELAPAMKVFATHSRHMQNSWANVGPADGPEFYKAAVEAIDLTKKKKCVNYFPLLDLIDEMENSADILLAKLPQNILKECKLHLEQFKRISRADRVAVKCLQDKTLYPELKTLKNEITEHTKEAILSEKSALQFIDDVINFFEK